MESPEEHGIVKTKMLEMLDEGEFIFSITAGLSPSDNKIIFAFGRPDKTMDNDGLLVAAGMLSGLALAILNGAQPEIAKTIHEKIFCEISDWKPAEPLSTPSEPVDQPETTVLQPTVENSGQPDESSPEVVKALASNET
ncbi:hypothetical protein HAP94_07165 [Acidithiobacillus ferrivorans]|nr:hypothetical protein [Acidithiobacillus ferrivorans]